MISYIRETDIPGKTGQCAPRLSFKSEQQQGAPDSSSAVVDQFGMGRPVVAVMMEEARLFDPSLLTQWFQSGCTVQQVSSIPAGGTHAHCQGSGGRGNQAGLVISGDLLGIVAVMTGNIHGRFSLLLP